MVAGGALLGTAIGASEAGFTANGIAAGSSAAAWQSTIGNVGSGSLFAFL